MAYSLDQAKLLLQTTELTQQALTNLVKQISVETSGTTTIFYGGILPDGANAGDVVSKMVAAGDDIRVIDKSAAGLFLTSTEFKTAAGKASGLSGSQLLDYVEGRLPRMAETDWVFAADPNTSPWAAASKNFAQATTGEVRLMVSGSGADRIFNQAELPALLQNASVTKIDGYDIDSLKAMYPEAGRIPPDTVKLFSDLKLSSERNIVLSGFTAVTDSNGSVVSVNKGNLLAPDLQDVSYLKSHPEKLQVWADYLKLHPDRVSPFTEFSKLHLETVKTLVNTGGTVALKAAKVLGPIGAILGLTMASAQAAEAESQGNHEQAKEIMKLWAIDAGGSELGSIAGAAIGGIAVAAAAALGVALSAPLAGALVVGGAIFGGIYGGDGATEFYHLLDDRDNNGKRDIVDKLANLLFGATSTITTPLSADLNGEKFTIDASLTRDEMVALAKGTDNTAMAWRYALRELNPFVISDVSYAAHNTDGSLDLYNPDTGQGSMTEAYLADRAAMLNWKLAFDRRNARDSNDAVREGGASKPYNEEWDSNTVQGNWDFIDLGTRLPGGAPLTLAIDGVGLSLYDHQVVFGSKNADTIEGNGDTDKLYGMAGDDTLNGKAGDDYLEGGSGSDTYQFSGSWGKDTIIDSDGQGQITIDGDSIGAVQGTGGHWAFKTTAGVQYDLALLTDSRSNTGYKLQIAKKGDSTNSITINHFDAGAAINGNGYLGMQLGKMEVAVVATGSIPSSDGPSFWSKLGATLNDLVGKSTEVAEGAGKSFTVYLSQAAKLGDTITLALNGLADKFKAQIGGSTVDANGAVISLTEGQTSVSFALTQQGATSTDASTALSATYQGVGQSAASNSFGIQLKDAGEVVKTYRGDQHGVVLVNGGVAVYDWSGTSWAADGTLVNGVEEAGYGDVILGSAGNDKMLGLGGNDALEGLAGNDQIDGGDGNDLIAGGMGADNIKGGAGDDTIFSDAYFRNWDGTALRQHTYVQPVGTPDEWQRPQQWNGQWLLPAGANVVADGGTWGTYELNGVRGTSVYYDVGLDVASDVVDAGDGRDYVRTGAGDDRILGGAGDDVLYAAAGSDVVEGGTGDDKLYGDEAGVSEDKHGNDFLDGGEGSDLLIGGGRDDVLYGGSGADTLRGDGTVDVQYSGNDYLDGEDGNDTLVGGDTLTGGGTGIKRFLWNSQSTPKMIATRAYSVCARGRFGSELRRAQHRLHAASSPAIKTTKHQGAHHA